MPFTPPLPAPAREGRQSKRSAFSPLM